MQCTVNDENGFFDFNELMKGYLNDVVEGYYHNTKPSAAIKTCFICVLISIFTKLFGQFILWTTIIGQNILSEFVSWGE